MKKPPQTLQITAPEEIFTLGAHLIFTEHFLIQMKR